MVPQICVIVPVYKVEKYIHRCVDSILAQTLQRFELVLVDDGSPDGCGAICDAYALTDPRVRVLHRENGGLSAARNTGIIWMLQNSTCPYLTFIDSDDWIHPQYLEILLHSLEVSGAEVSMVGRVYTDRFTGTYDRFESLPEPVLYGPEALFLSREWDFNYAWGKLYRRDHFLTLRYPEGKSFEDVFTTYQVFFSAEKIALADVGLYCYFRNAEGISHSPWTPKELVIFEGMEQQLAFYKEKGYARAYEKEERLYVHHHAYQLIRIRENRIDWKKNKPIWRKVRRKMLALMKASGGKYTFQTMPYCFGAAHPYAAGIKALAGHAVNAWKRYGFRGILKKIKGKLGE